MDAFVARCGYAGEDGFEIFREWAQIVFSETPDLCHGSPVSSAELYTSEEVKKTI